MLCLLGKNIIVLVHALGSVLSGYTSKYSHCGVACAVLEERRDCSKSHQGQDVGRQNFTGNAMLTLCTQQQLVGLGQSFGGKQHMVFFLRFFLSSSSSGGPCKPTAWQVCIWWAKTASQASSPLCLSLLWVYIRSISAAAAAVWLHDLLVCSQWKIKRNGLEKQRRQN